MSRADTLSGPLRRMSMFFLGDALPAVAGAPDIYAAAKDLKVRGVPVRKTEEDLLTKTLWCILQVQHDQEESEQHAALALLAALVPWYWPVSISGFTTLISPLKLSTGM